MNDVKNLYEFIIKIKTNFFNKVNTLTNLNENVSIFDTNNSLTFINILIILYLYNLFLRYTSKIKTNQLKNSLNQKLSKISIVKVGNVQHKIEVLNQILNFLISIFVLVSSLNILNINNIITVINSQTTIFLFFLLFTIIFIFFFKNQEANTFGSNTHFLFILVISLLSVTQLVSTLFTNLFHFLILIEVFSYALFSIFSILKDSSVGNLKNNEKMHFTFKNSLLQYIVLNFITSILMILGIYICFKNSLSTSLFTIINDISLTELKTSNKQNLFYATLLILFSIIIKLGVTPFHIYTEKMYKGFSIIALYIYT